eukprot:Platyproteum_vivax@DN3392_c0_g1_i1.p1
MSQIRKGQSFSSSIAPSQDGSTYNAVDINRLMKLKQQQEEALKTIETRITHLAVTEKKVWTDIERQKMEAEKLEEAHERFVEKTQNRMRRARTHDSEVQRLQAVCRTEREGNQHRQHIAAVGALQNKMMTSDEVRNIKNQIRKETEHNNISRLQHNLSLKEQIRCSAQQQKLFQQFLKQQKEQEIQAQKALQFSELEDSIRLLQERLCQAEQDELEAISRLRDTQILQQKSCVSTTVGSRLSANISSRPSSSSTVTTGSSRVRAKSIRGTASEGVLGGRKAGAAPPRVGRSRNPMPGPLRRSSSNNVHANIRPLSARIPETHSEMSSKLSAVNLAMLENSSVNQPLEIPNNVTEPLQVAKQNSAEFTLESISLTKESKDKPVAIIPADEPENIVV